MANYIPAINIPQRAPDIIVHGSVQTDPASSTVMVTSGSIPGLSPSNHALVVARIQADDSVPTFDVLHLNAAGSTVDTAYIAAASSPGDWWGVFNLVAAGDVIEVKTATAGTSAKNYQCDLYIWRY